MQTSGKRLRTCYIAIFLSSFHSIEPITRANCFVFSLFSLCFSSKFFLFRGVFFLCSLAHFVSYHSENALGVSDLKVFWNTVYAQSEKKITADLKKKRQTNIQCIQRAVYWILQLVVLFRFGFTSKCNKLSWSKLHINRYIDIYKYIWYQSFMISFRCGIEHFMA